MNQITSPSECPQTMPEIINDVEKRFDKNESIPKFWVKEVLGGLLTKGDKGN